MAGVSLELFGCMQSHGALNTGWWGDLAGLTDNMAMKLKGLYVQLTNDMHPNNSRETPAIYLPRATLCTEHKLTCCQVLIVFTVHTTII